MKTITYDEAVYKLVPVAATERILTAAACTSHDNTPSGGSGFTFRQNMAKLEYEAMLAAVPDTLPGVVEHSGKPDHWIMTTPGQGNQILITDPQAAKRFAEMGGRKIEAFYTHADTAEVAALKARIAELEAQVEAAQYATEGRKQKERIAELKAQIAAQAGQEVGNEQN